MLKMLGIWQVLLPVALASAGGHSDRDDSINTIIRRSSASDSVAPVPPSPSSIWAHAADAAHNGASGTLTKSFLVTSDIVVTSYVASASPSWTLSESPSASSATSNHAQATGTLPTSTPSSGDTSSAPPAPISTSPSSTGLPKESTLATASSSVQLSGSTPQANAISPAPSAVDSSGSSLGGSGGKEKVWWVAFLVPLLLLA